MQKSFVVLNRDDNVIEAGENGQVNFFVKKDGSSSLGTGLNGMSFLALNDTPNRVENRVLGGRDGKLAFLREVDLDKVSSKAIKTQDMDLEGVLKVVGQINNIGAFNTRSINVEDNLQSKTASVRELESDHMYCKLVDSVKVKCGELFADNLAVMDVELGGYINKSAIRFGTFELPINISAAEEYVFRLGRCSRLEIIGRHFHTKLEFKVVTELVNVCHSRNVSVNVMSLYGDELVVMGTMVKQVEPYKISVQVHFDKTYKNDIIEKVVVSVD